MNSPSSILTGAQWSLSGLRALFYLGFYMGICGAFYVCLLFVPFALLEQENPQRAGSGVGAPPPPTLESLSAFSGWGSAERRILTPPPLFGRGSLWIQAWHRFVLPKPAPTSPRRPALAAFQQWQLEGG